MPDWPGLASCEGRWGGRALCPPDPPLLLSPLSSSSCNARPSRRQACLFHSSDSSSLLLRLYLFHRSASPSLKHLETLPCCSCRTGDCHAAEVPTTLRPINVPLSAAITDPWLRAPPAHSDKEMGGATKEMARRLTISLVPPGHGRLRVGRVGGGPACLADGGALRAQLLRAAHVLPWSATPPAISCLPHPISPCARALPPISPLVALAASTRAAFSGCTSATRIISRSGQMAGLTALDSDAALTAAWARRGARLRVS